jgi:hypothetical protein
MTRIARITLPLPILVIPVIRGSVFHQFHLGQNHVGQNHSATMILSGDPVRIRLPSIRLHGIDETTRPRDYWTAGLRDLELREAPSRGPVVLLSCGQVVMWSGGHVVLRYLLQNVPAPLSASRLRAFAVSIQIKQPKREAAKQVLQEELEEAEMRISSATSTTSCSKRASCGSPLLSLTG